MITGNYSLPASPEWRNVQFEDVFLECDTTLGDVNLTLPNIADLNRSWSVRLHIINKVGANKVNVIAYTTLLPVPVTNLINGVASVTLSSVGDSCIVAVEDEDNWLSTASGASTSVPTVAPAAAQAYFATAPVVALPIGSQVAITDYNASGEGGVFVKTALTAGTFADWICVSTTDAPSTGAIGANPA